MGLILGKWVSFCGRRHWLVLAAGVLLAACALWLASTRLGVTTDTGNLFSASLPWRQHAMAVSKAFPQQTDLLVAVIDGATPEEADATAASLAAALSGDHTHFKSVTRPDASPYLQRNGLLFLDTLQLQALLNQTIDAQPFLGQLAADPSLRGLLNALGLIAEGVQAGQAELGSFQPALAGFHTALAQAVAGHPEPLSWERLLSGPVANLAGKYRFVLAKPVLDFSALEPGAAATQVLRADAAALEFVRDGRAHVHLTGNVALEDEEFATVAQGAVAGLIGSLVLVTVLLFLAVKSWRLVVPIVLTLLLGLISTTGFAALAVGTLNLVSVAFAVLFTGIAVDFSIQFVVRFRQARVYFHALPVALLHTGRRAGAQILVASLASMAGFIAFTPTNFVGVAQLGLIAGCGMPIAFFCTVTFLPAILAAFNPRWAMVEVGLGFLKPVDPFLVHWRRYVVTIFAALAFAGAALLPHLGFDSDPLHTKDPNSEAVRTLEDLANDPITDPYTIDILASSPEAAAALGTQIAKLPTVRDVLSVRSFVPADQAQKLPLIQDAATLLESTLSPGAPPPPPTAAQIRDDATRVAAVLDKVRGKLPPDSALIPIIGDLQALSRAPDQILLETNTAMTRFLPLQLDRLRDALQAGPVTQADIPPDIRQNWLLPDGHAKLQVIPKPDATTSDGLHRFVAQVTSVAPDAGGAAVTIVGSADTIVSAFRTAAMLALAAVAILLLVALRHLLDVALVLAPLLVSAMLTVLLAVALPLPLNFANIIALPLLLGVGVSFNVYFVMNWRARKTLPLGSATARAVLFSALTTSTAFGSLALSPHPGTASMGKLLLLSLGCTLLTTMLFLPALLAWVGMPAVLKASHMLARQQARRRQKERA